MNLNMFLTPSDAQSELALKLGAQKRELERALTEIGYDMLLREGTQVGFSFRSVGKRFVM